MRNKVLNLGLLMFLIGAPADSWAVRAIPDLEKVEIAKMHLFKPAGNVSVSTNTKPPPSVEIYNAKEITPSNPTTCPQGKHICAVGYDQELGPVERVLLVYREVGRSH